MAEFGTYRYALMDGIFKDCIDPERGIYGENIKVECSFLLSDGNYSTGVTRRMNIECDFSDLFLSPDWNTTDVYVLVSNRKSKMFTHDQLKEFTAQTVDPRWGPAIPETKININVTTKTFFIRLIFYHDAPSRPPHLPHNPYGGIQMIISVSSIAAVDINPPGNIYSGVDVQFGIIFIGPVKVAAAPGGLPTFTADATVLATMADYLSVGCAGTTKMADYTTTSGSKQQFIAPIDDHFKLAAILCDQYILTFISPTNSRHDFIMRLFRHAFDGDHQNNGVIRAITSKWGWDAGTLHSITAFRKRMTIVVDILVSPAIERIYLSNLEKDDLHQGRPSSRPSKRRHSSHGGRKTVKNMKRYKSRHNKSKSKPNAKSKLKCKRLMNMHTRRRCYT